MSNLNFKTAGYGFAFGVVGITALFGSWYTVDQRDVGIVQRNGKVIEQVDPGLHFKLPFFDRVTDMNVRTQVRHYEKLNTYSKDIQAAEVNVTITYALDSASARKVFESYGPSYVASIVDPKVIATFKEQFGKLDASKIVNNRDTLATVVQGDLNDLLVGTGISIQSVQVADINFSREFEAAIEKAMKANAEFQEAQFAAQRDKAKAEGLANSEIERARGIRAVADAEAYAIERRGRALRENPALVEMTVAEKWNGVLPTTMVPGSAVPFIGVK